LSIVKTYIKIIPDYKTTAKKFQKIAKFVLIVDKKCGIIKSK